MNAGATISVTGTGSSGNSPAGTVTLTVGNYPSSPGVGAFTMDATSQILANSPLASAGPIVISAGEQMDINGLVESSSRLSGVPNQPPGGGTITLLSACRLTVGDSGVVSSEGKDPGADLVHLEGCDVFIYGIVRSNVVLAGGHSPPVNPPEPVQSRYGGASGRLQRRTPAASRSGNNVVIDNTGTHKGEVLRWRAHRCRRVEALVDRHFAKRRHDHRQHDRELRRPRESSGTNQFGGLITVVARRQDLTAFPGTVGLALQANLAPAAARAATSTPSRRRCPTGRPITADAIQASASSGGDPPWSHDDSILNDTILGIAPDS